MVVEHQQHLRSRLKHVLLNNFNYAEYILIVVPYLETNYM